MRRQGAMLSWFNGKPRSIFDMASKPQSRAAYRRLIVPLGRATGAPWAR
jgi:hypothetical protein